MAVALALTELPSRLEQASREIFKSALRVLVAALGAFLLTLGFLGRAAPAEDKVAIVLLGATAAVVLLLPPAAARAKAPMLAVLAVLSAGYPTFRFHPTVAREHVYPETAAVRTLLEERRRDPTLRVFTADRGCFPPNSPQVFGLSQALGYDAFDPFDFVRLLDVLTVPPGLPRVRWNTGSFELGSAPWRLLAARLVATDLELRPEGWRVVHEGTGFRIMEDPGALPRAFVVGGAYWIHEDPRRIARTPAREAVALESKEAVSVAAPAMTKGEAVIEALSPDELVVRTTTDGNGFLVVLDQFLPGWHAFVDERPVVIEKAFVCFRAVALPSGEHRVRFRYLPDSFVTGFWVSLSAVIGLVVLVALVAALRTR
jgi:hypothetical protein